jgi:alpha-beta hydrolase superfamily lysophospholipase
VLADSLTARGVAVLRHDDRGAGRSSRPTGPPRYRALLDDTRAAIAFVRARRELDARRVFLVGHSEGAKTCEVLAAEDSLIAGIALLAGATAVNVDSLLEEQAQVTPGGPASRLLSTLRRAQAGEHARDAADLTDWMREHLELEPRELLPRIRCPVLILQGGDDRLVRPHHAAAAAAAIAGGGNLRVTLRTFPGLTHAFTPSAGDAGPAGTGAASTLAEWIAAQVAR